MVRRVTDALLVITASRVARSRLRVRLALTLQPQAISYPLIAYNAQLVLCVLLLALLPNLCRVMRAITVRLEVPR